MPIPNPNSGEAESDFIARCVIDEVMTSEYSQSQALAICHQKWADRDKSMDENQKLLAAIKARATKSEPFNAGILTADAYVKTLQECAGVDICQRYAATKLKSFDDVLRKAAETLTYNNPEMLLEQKQREAAGGLVTSLPDGVELPKNTLMVFRHVLTTPRKDRDGDVLRTQGAVVDPKMLLLWQHVHTLPIGKMLYIAEHNSKKLSIVAAVVDMNELCHDAAVMIDNDMGRFSHGFRALEFSEIKAEEGDTTSPGGFDIKSFEIMEDSLVSVPSNTDSNTEEVILSLVEGGKLTSGIMKGFGQSIRAKQPTRVPIDVNINLAINGAKEVQNADQPGNGSGKTAGEGTGDKAGCGCTSKETNDNGQTKAEADKTDDAKVALSISEARKLGDVKSEDLQMDTKLGRVISAANIAKLEDVKADLQEIHDMANMTRAGKSLCNGCVKKLDDVIKSAGIVHNEETSTKPATKDADDMTIEEAMAMVIGHASQNEREMILAAYDAMDKAESDESLVKSLGI